MKRKLSVNEMRTNADVVLRMRNQIYNGLLFVHAAEATAADDIGRKRQHERNAQSTKIMRAHIHRQASGGNKHVGNRRHFCVIYGAIERSTLRGRVA